MGTRPIFPINIYEAEYPNFHSVKDQLYRAILPYFDDPFENKRRVDRFSDGDIKTLSTKFEVHKDPALKDLVDFIEHHMRVYWKDCGYTDKIDPYITVMWALLTSKGGFTAPHNHNPWPIGGSFYINADTQSGDLYLENPLEILLGKQPVEIDGPTTYTERIPVSPGKLVLFPGWIRHHSLTNTLQDKRMVLGFVGGCHFISKQKDAIY